MYYFGVIHKIVGAGPHTLKKKAFGFINVANFFS
jgi:hypothetical protein